MPVALGTLRTLAAGLGSAADDLPSFSLADAALAEAARLVFRFQRFHVGVELRSERFLDEALPVGARHRGGISPSGSADPNRGVA